MSDTIVTLYGWVGAEVSHRTWNGVSVASFRVATTPRIRRGGQWQDGETIWYSVSVWRNLADHVRDSVKTGDAVIVHGRLRTETWQPEGAQSVTRLHVEATLVGHDLNRGTAVFLKASRPERETDVESELAAMIHEGEAEAPQLDRWGNPKAAEPAQGTSGGERGAESAA